MEQRRLRLGDILDDYCPRERRVTNHAVVAMIEEDVKQTRCTTCDAEHVYKGGKAPRRKKTETGALYKEVLAGITDQDRRRVLQTSNPSHESDVRRRAVDPPSEPAPPRSCRRRCQDDTSPTSAPSRRRAGPSPADPRAAAAARRDQDRASGCPSSRSGRTAPARRELPRRLRGQRRRRHARGRRRWRRRRSRSGGGPQQRRQRFGAAGPSAGGFGRGPASGRAGLGQPGLRAAARVGGGGQQSLGDRIVPERSRDMKRRPTLPATGVPAGPASAI